MAGPSPPAPGTQLSLCDMPDPWMQQLAHLADSPCILALMRTCRAMRNLALTERPSYVQLPLPFIHTEAAALIDKLQLACTYASKVHLRLTWDPAVQTVQGSSDSNGYHLMYGAGAALALKAGVSGTKPLTGITNVEMHDMFLAELVPAWLTLTCPNMTQLGLTSCHLGELAPPTRAIHQGGQLQRLWMMDCTAQPAHVPNWQHAFRVLPSLTQLHSETFGNNHSELPTLEMCSAIGAQLTSLRIWAGDLTSMSSARRVQEVQQLAAWFPSLCNLRLPARIVNDAVMTALLQLPPRSLQRFECPNFLLEQSYEETHSPWVNLHVNEVSVKQFSKLPWQGVASVSTGSLRLNAAATSMTAANRVTAATASCGGIQWPDLNITVEPPRCAAIRAEGTDSAGLAAALSLLRGSPAVRLTIHGGTGLTDTFVQALQLHLPRHIHTIAFKACTWTPGVLRHLLPSLPAYVRTINLGGALSETQVIMVCVSAVRSIELQLKIRPAEEAEWRARLQGFMREAGHQHVQLTFMEIV